MPMDEDRFSHGLTRREFLRLMSLGTGVVVTGSLAGCGDFIPVRQDVIPVESWHKGVCRFCGTGCGVQIGVTAGRVVDVKGDEYAHNRGRLCIKGIMNRDILYVRDRALHPMIRRNGELQQASWDEAMELIATRFRESIDQHGPNSVAFYGSGQLFTQESYTASKLFKAGIGTNNVDGNPRLCMASAAVGYVSVFGKDEPMGCYEDIDHADCFFITGSNTAECHPIIWERVLDRRRSHPATYLIVVDPRITRTAVAADLHLPILPGTDVALYNGIINELLQQGFFDQEMVDQYLTFRQGEDTRTFAEFQEFIGDFTAEAVAAICGIQADQIREAAYRFGSAQASMSLWTMGINQQFQGSAANRLVNAMHLLTGHIGRPGATPFSLTGQPNAGGGVRDTGALSHTLPNGRLINNADHRAEMEELWNVPSGSIHEEPGFAAVGMFEAMERGDVRCCLVMCTNPAHSLPNADRYRQAMDDAFLVVADSIYPTETTQYADVFLPTAMWAEKEGMFSQSERRYHLVPKLVEAPGEARSDLDILVEFAQRLGFDDLIKAHTPREIWEEWRIISQASFYDFSGMTYERLEQERGLLWPCPTEDHPGTCRRYVPGEDPFAEGPGRLDFYGRPDGKAVIWMHEQAEPQDPTSDEFPLILTTGRVLEHWHTKTITGKINELEPIDTDFLQINPVDAAQRAIADGDKVVVASRRGTTSEFIARITADVRPGVIFTTFHSFQPLINRVTADVVDPISREPDYKRCAVQVAKGGA